MLTMSVPGTERTSLLHAFFMLFVNPFFQQQIRHLLKLSHIIGDRHGASDDGVSDERRIVRADRRAGHLQRASQPYRHAGRSMQLELPDVILVWMFLALRDGT